jgi:hypothetical protein
MVRERVMVDSAIDFGVRIPRSFGAELPYCPVFAVFGVEELDERVERVAIVALGVGSARAGGRDDCMAVSRNILERPEEANSGLSHSRGQGRLLGAWRVGLRLFGGAAMPGGC